MIHLFFNALAASAGAGLTYVRNVVPEIARRDDAQATVLLSPELRKEFEDPHNIAFVEVNSLGSARRFWQEQTLVPALVRKSQADVLISTGNFALRRSPVPQILLSGNSLYTSSDFFQDLVSRGAWGPWLDTRLKAAFAKRSIYWADATVAPSRAFAGALQSWTGRKVHSIYHGFDRDTFFRDAGPLPAAMQEKIRSADGSLKLLFVSHYNYYRNFETLFRALPSIRQALGETKLRLFLTCELRAGANPGSYRTDAAANLVSRLGIRDEVIELGAVPYRLLHHLYTAADIYVTPAYTETFAHPLVEAMASGLPIVASDIAVHREICGDGAVFFDRFSAERLSEEVLRLARSDSAKRRLAEQGGERLNDFSWHSHVSQLVSLSEELLRAARPT